ncbi:SRPBCC domain-containing protein [Streptomyces sp. B21-106]|uniref:SRPBCC domain-containing protein n=1 Tax=Streptomyces sp. B21-106 TaxID=3039418 RepID=UPI002FF17FD8
MTEAQKVPDVRKTVTVDVPADRAFAIFAERPIEWFPERHVFVEDRVSLTIEPFEGGRYYEVGADGTDIAWGTVVEWNPSKRIVLTWRVGPHWQPIFDDEKASFIEVDFEPAGPGGRPWRSRTADFTGTARSRRRSTRRSTARAPGTRWPATSRSSPGSVRRRRRSP